MPMVVPVVAGAWSMYAGITAATMMGGLMAAGGFLTMVGGLTGDRDALKFGSMLSLVGGVGGALANGATAATSNAAGQAASETANATAGATVADAIGNAPIDQVVSSGAGLPAGIGEVGGVTGVADSGLIADAAGGLADKAGTGLADAAAPRLAEASDALAAAGDPNKSALFGAKGFGDGMSGEATGVFDAGVQSTAEAKWGSLGDMFGKAENWMKENPNLAKVGSGIIKGATDYLGERQQMRDRMNAEKSYRDWVRQRYSDSVRNLVIPSPIGAPAPTGGIIAGQRG